MIITRRSLSRRTVLRGLGASVALPLLDAMVPALSAAPKVTAPVPRLAFFYVPNGMFPPAFHPAGTGGTNFDLTPVLQPLAAFRDQLTVISTDGAGAMRRKRSGLRRRRRGMRKAPRLTTKDGASCGLGGLGS